MHFISKLEKPLSLSGFFNADNPGNVPDRKPAA